jgi:RecJ-like exonuclease
MKPIYLLLAMAVVLFTACDPKVDQRAPRYTATDCPICTDGVCHYCGGDAECQYCDGSGTRVSSTKNYTGEKGRTGEDVQLVDITEPCPFCKATGKCHHCEGTAKCLSCDGTGKVENWDYLNKKTKK